MLVVYLSNKYVRIIDGSASKGKLNVQGMYYTIDSQGAYLNGTIVNRDELVAMLKNLWETNHLPKKQVYLILNSNQISARILDAPVLNERATVAYISRELSGLDRMTDPVYGYFRMNREGKMQRILAMAAPRDYIQQFVDVFKEVGVQLHGVESVKGAMVRLTMTTPQLKDKTCAVQFLDGSNLTNVLMVDGKFQSFNEKRLFNEPGEPQYIMEVARAINEILQFAKAQSIEQTVSHIFVSGMSAEDFPFYEEGVQRIRDDLECAELNGDNVQFHCKRDQEKTFSHFALAIGGLFSAGDENNMMEQMRYTPEQMEKRRGIRRMLIPSVTIIGACVIITLVLFLINIQRKAKLADLRAYNQNPEVTAQVKEYNDLMVRSGAISEIGDGMNEFLVILKEFPKVDSALVADIETCTQGKLVFEVEGFDAASGVLSFSAQAMDVEEIHQFVNRLKKTDLFAKIEYSGYSQNADGSYSLKLHCTMAAVMPEETEEEAAE